MSYTLEMEERFVTDRSAEDAFDYITDFSRICEWDHTIVSARKTSNGKIGLGTLFDLEYALGLRRIPMRYEITEFEANSRAVLVGSAKGFTATDTVTISEHNGQRQVIWHARIEFSGTAAKLIPLIQKRVEKAGRQTIKDLATALADNYPVPQLSTIARIADKLVLPGVSTFSKLGYALGKREWNPVTRSVKGKHIVLTGATSGLGLATATELAHRGAHLTLVARSKSKVEAVVGDIKSHTGNKNINYELADLSLMSEVLALAARLQKQNRPIDVLVNNAGALFNKRELTTENLEQSFALLLLGPYLLTEALFPLLKEANHARVINIASGGMYATRLSVSNLQSTKGEYKGAEAYARCKRGLVIMSERWAERWKHDGIIVHSMHPGWAATPGVEAALPQFNKLMKYALRTSAQGADTIVWLSCASEVEKATGLFWLDREPHSTHLLSSTREKPSQRDELESYLQNLAEGFA